MYLLFWIYTRKTAFQRFIRSSLNTSVFFSFSAFFSLHWRTSCSKLILSNFRCQSRHQESESSFMSAFNRTDRDTADTERRQMVSNMLAKFHRLGAESVQALAVLISSQFIFPSLYCSYVSLHPMFWLPFLKTSEYEVSFIMFFSLSPISCIDIFMSHWVSLSSCTSAVSF